MLMVFTQSSNALTTVKIRNTLDAAKDLLIHCRSKTDDLGEHLLHFEDSYFFSFQPNFIDPSGFYCSFKWDSRTRWFDFYSHRRDHYRCGNDFCQWDIEASRLCLVNNVTSKFDTCEKWNS
ncbi:Plant self-incompatibility protein S1 family [Euphorbia peplus]|nr:Plant self-incompatibility protein S1 family [Euphorbia peplus]